MSGCESQGWYTSSQGGEREGKREGEREREIEFDMVTSNLSDILTCIFRTHKY